MCYTWLRALCDGWRVYKEEEEAFTGVRMSEPRIFFSLFFSWKCEESADMPVCRGGQPVCNALVHFHKEKKNKKKKNDHRIVSQVLHYMYLYTYTSLHVVVYIYIYIDSMVDFNLLSDPFSFSWSLEP